MHNFHDTNKFLPNNGRCCGGDVRDWTALFQILPNIEQGNVYNPIFTAAQAAAVSGGVPPNQDWPAISQPANSIVGIKVYMCPSRKRAPTFAQAGGNSPGWAGPFTDYKMNWQSFENRTNAPAKAAPPTNNFSAVTLERLVNNRGSSNLIVCGEGFLRTDMYGYNQSNNWEENIYSGGYGGTGRGDGCAPCNGTTIKKDNNVDGQNNFWGGPHTGVTLFLLGDGSVRQASNNLSGTQNMLALLHWNSNSTLGFDN
jgi:hypothetical protein